MLRQIDSADHSGFPCQLLIDSLGGADSMERWPCCSNLTCHSVSLATSGSTKGGGAVACHALHAQCLPAPDGTRAVVCADAVLALCEQCARHRRYADRGLEHPDLHCGAR